MAKIEVKSFNEILKETLRKCKTTDEKMDKLIDIFVSQTNLLDIVLNNLSPELTKKILKQAGFKEMVMD